MNGDHHYWTAFTRLTTRLNALSAPFSSGKAFAGLLAPVAVPRFEVDVNQPETLHLENDQALENRTGKEDSVSWSYLP